ncbi:MAG TPA: hypothetical protein VI231_08950 [Candidatus Binatia bacterium]|jgi:hypothetical protein
MAVIGSTWIVILRCYDCNALFTLKAIPGSEIGATADSCECPKCGANGDSTKTFPARRHHLIVKLSREGKNAERR